MAEPEKIEIDDFALYGYKKIPDYIVKKAIQEATRLPAGKELVLAFQPFDTKFRPQGIYPATITNYGLATDSLLRAFDVDTKQPTYLLSKNGKLLIEIPPIAPPPVENVGILDKDNVRINPATEETLKNFKEKWVDFRVKDEVVGADQIAHVCSGDAWTVKNMTIEKDAKVVNEGEIHIHETLTVDGKLISEGKIVLWGVEVPPPPPPPPPPIEKDVALIMCAGDGIKYGAVSYG